MICPRIFLLFSATRLSFTQGIFYSQFLLEVVLLGVLTCLFQARQPLLYFSHLPPELGLSKNTSNSKLYILKRTTYHTIKLS